MGFDTLVVNGRVVTATDTYPSDIAISGGKIEAIGKNLSRENAKKVIDAKGKYVLPGGIDVHTHLDMPFGGTTSADDFETGTRAGCVRRHHHAHRLRHPVQRPDPAHRLRYMDAESLRQGRQRLRVSLHHHRPRLDAQLEEMNALVREGVTSFKLFMAYPGVFMLDDAQHLQSLPRHREERWPGLHACGERQCHRRDRAAGAGGREEGSEVSRAHAAHDRRGRSHRTRHRACRDGWSAGLHRSPELQRGARESPRGPRSRAACLRRDLSAVSLPLARKHGRARASKAPSTSSRRRCARSGIRRNSGTASSRITCKSSPPTTARSASRNRRNSAKTTSPRFPTAARASSTA